MSEQQVNSIDLKIVFSEDAKEWDKYLTDCLTESIESISFQLKIVHERIENLHVSNFQEDDQLKISLSTLIIISPDFLSFVQQNDSLNKFFGELAVDRTICMLCGVRENEISNKIKENLVKFDCWKCLIAKEQDNDFIYTVIDTICEILHRNRSNFEDTYSPYSFITSLKTKRPIPNHSNEYKNLDSIKVTDEPVDKSLPNKRIIPKFKITPKRVKKGDNKVFILLDQPIEDLVIAKVTLEFKTPSKSNQKCRQELREIEVKKKNSDTLQFHVTDDLLTSTKVIRVNLFLEQKGQINQLGVRLLKCECTDNSIENLTNCLPILKMSFGMHSIEELDSELARRFRRTVPVDELNRILDNHSINQQKPVIEDLLTGDHPVDRLNKNEQIVKRTSVNNNNKLSTVNTSIIDRQTKNHSKLIELELPTLLHFAAEHNFKQFASSLLEFEASTGLCSIKNCHGLTPLSIAKLNGHNEISKLIKNYTQKLTTDQQLEDQIDLSDQLDYVNMSSVRLPICKNSEQTSDFTSDGSDQSSIDGVDSVDGMIMKSRSIIRSATVNEYDFIGKTRPIRLGKLIDLDSLSISSESSTDKLLPPKSSKATCPLINLDELKQRSECYEYDIVKSSPRRADIPVDRQDRLINSFNNKLDNCKANLLNRFDELRISSSSSNTSRDTADRKDPLKSIEVLQTYNLTEPQIELLNTAKAFKMGAYTNDELERKFREWATKYHYKIDQNSQSDSDSHTINRMGKRSVSSSHLLSQDMKSESKDSGCSSRSSTIKTCLSNINLNSASSPSKFYQFSLTDWFHQLTAKLKHNNNRTGGNHKSPKFEKKDKIASPSKASSHWTKKLSSSNVRKSLFDSKDFEKSPSKSKNNGDARKFNIQESKQKSMTLPLRTPVSNKSSSPTAKLRNKLNFKKNNSKTNVLNVVDTKIQNSQAIGDRVIDTRTYEQINDKLNDKLKDKLADKLNSSDRMSSRIDTLAERLSDNINNNNIINNVPVPFAYSSFDKEWNAMRLDENGKIVINRKIEQKNSTFEYDRLPLNPPVLARKVINN